MFTSEIFSVVGEVGVVQTQPGGHFDGSLSWGAARDAGDTYVSKSGEVLDTHKRYLLPAGPNNIRNGIDGWDAAIPLTNVVALAGDVEYDAVAVHSADRVNDTTNVLVISANVPTYYISPNTLDYTPCAVVFKGPIGGKWPLYTGQFPAERCYTKTMVWLGAANSATVGKIMMSPDGLYFVVEVGANVQCWFWNGSVWVNKGTKTGYSISTRECISETTVVLVQNNIAYSFSLSSWTATSAAGWTVDPVGDIRSACVTRDGMYLYISVNNTIQTWVSGYLVGVATPIFPTSITDGVLGRYIMISHNPTTNEEEHMVVFCKGSNSDGPDCFIKYPMDMRVPQPNADISIQTYDAWGYPAKVNISSNRPNMTMDNNIIRTNLIIGTSVWPASTPPACYTHLYKPISTSIQP